MHSKSFGFVPFLSHAAITDIFPLQQVYRQGFCCGSLLYPALQSHKCRRWVWKPWAWVTIAYDHSKGRGSFDVTFLLLESPGYLRCWKLGARVRHFMPCLLTWHRMPTHPRATIPTAPDTPCNNTVPTRGKWETQQKGISFFLST